MSGLCFSKLSHASYLVSCRQQYCIYPIKRHVQGTRRQNTKQTIQRVSDGNLQKYSVLPSKNNISKETDQHVSDGISKNIDLASKVYFFPFLGHSIYHPSIGQGRSQQTPPSIFGLLNYFLSSSRGSSFSGLSFFFSSSLKGNSCSTMESLTKWLKPIFFLNSLAKSYYVSEHWVHFSWWRKLHRNYDVVSSLNVDWAYFDKNLHS